MKNSIKIASPVLLLVMLVFNVFGCSRFSSEPSDEDIIRAINESGLNKASGFTVTSPIVIVEKGKRQEDGSWPVKVKFKVRFILTKDGSSREVESETSPSYRIYKTKGSTGKSVWAARLGE